MAGDFLRDLSIELQLESDHGAIKRIVEMQREMDRLTRQTQIFDKQFSRSMVHMPEHLKPFATQIHETDLQMRSFTRNATYNLEEMQDTVLKTRVGLDKLTSVSASGKDVIKQMQAFREETRITRMAILGFNEDATKKLTADEIQKRLGVQNERFAETRQYLEELKEAGNISAYTSGMQLLNSSLHDLQEALSAAATGGDRFLEVLSEMGVYTQANADAAALLMETYRESFFNSFNYIMGSATQTQSVINNLANLHPFYSLSQGTLGVANSLELMARQGTAAALAVRILGTGASMSQLNSMMRLINAGLVRMQMLVFGVGTAWVATTAILVKAALGPDPSEVRSQQQEVTDAYTKALNDRYNEIRGFAGMFEEVTSNFVNPATLQKNLDKQVNILRNWTTNLRSLGARGLSSDFIAELQKMGPEAAGEIAALNQMTDSELNKYVSTWREKNALARTQAMSELDKLRQQTEAQVAKLTASLTPLGESAEKFKTTWATVFGPFVDLFGRVASKIVDAGTAIGNFFNWVNKLNPIIGVLINSFLYLTLTFTLLLAPMAVGIGLSGGLAASFTALWAVIGPFIIGLGTVLGVAAAVAAAIVAVGAAIYFAYKYITPFREAVNAAFEGVKAFFNGILEQIRAFWATNGPMVMQAFQNIANFFIAVFNFLKPALAVIWQGILFIIMAVWGNIKGVIQGAVGIILNIIQIFGALFTGNWSALWAGIKGLLASALQLIWNLVQLTFLGRLLAPMRAGFAIMRTIVSGGWTAIKAFFMAGVNFVKNIVTAHVQFMSLRFTALWNTIKTIFIGIKNTIITVWNSIMTFLRGINLVTIGKNIIQGLINGIKSMVGKTKDIIVGLANSIKDAFTGLFDINSPSRVFKEYGVNTLEGYQLGLQNMQPKVVQQMEMSGQAIMQPMQTYSDAPSETMSPAYTQPKSTSSVTFAPNITVSAPGATAETVTNIRAQVDLAIEESWKSFARRNTTAMEG